ncbi:MAG TPA: hypothetical protein VFT61_10375 [Sphingomicrobium sp.]|nr:hypothetical protein [Sphingomicrobium sp.]
MRKLLISLAAAASTLTVAAPASAQWYPQPGPYAGGYGGYGGYSTPAAMQEFQARLQRIRAHVQELGMRGVISPWQVDRFQREADATDRQMWRKARHGLSYGDRMSVNERIARLQEAVEMTARGNAGYGRRYGW